MALINCSNCDKQISDKAKVCPHCGQELVVPLRDIEPEKPLCEECGSEIPAGSDSCPNCGCPVSYEDKPEDEVPQKVELTAVNLPKINKGTRKKIIIAAVAVAALVFAILLGASSSKKQQAEQYAENLDLATWTMLIGAVEAEDAGNLIKSVWYNAIYEEYDTATDKYTRPRGYWVGDFNDALGNLFSDSTFIADITSIETNQKTVSNLMKELRDPPEEYEDAYEALKELYEAYTALTNLVTDPTGSLTTFSQNFNDADTKLANCYDAMDLYLE